MFGYVKIYKPELKVKHYEAYKGVYCSLCKTLRKEYGILASFTLNYDFTLLALTRMAFAKECCGFKDSRCAYNPLKKCQQCVGGADELSYSAAAAMIMCYHKVNDDIADSSFLKGLIKRIIKPYFAFKRKKAMKKYKQLDDIISAAMSAQSEIEKKENAGIDASAHPSAKAMGEILSLGFEGETKEALERFGYLVGRWVYLMDALDDMESDRKTHSYNVFNNIKGASLKTHRTKSCVLFFRQIAQKCSLIHKVLPALFEQSDKKITTQYLHTEFLEMPDEKEKKEKAVGVLNLTAAQLARELDKMKPARFGEILENIVIDGTYNSMNQIIKKEEKEK